jgi:hypothetical protein
VSGFGRRALGARGWLAAVSALALGVCLSAGEARAAGGAYAVDDAEINPVGTCKVESWASFGDNSDRVFSSVPACDIDIGRPVEIAVPIQRTRSGGAWGSDIALTAKMPLIPITLGGVGMALAGGTSFDLVTGDNEGAFIVAPLSWQPRESLRLNVNLGLAYDSGLGQTVGNLGTGFDLALADPLHLIGEVYAHLGDGGRNPRAQVGLRYTPVEFMDIDVIYGRNIAGEDANWITLGLNLRFDTQRALSASR